jgi:hypothetical protein
LWSIRCGGWVRIFVAGCWDFHLYAAHAELISDSWRKTYL